MALATARRPLFEREVGLSVLRTHTRTHTHTHTHTREVGLSVLRTPSASCSAYSFSASSPIPPGVRVNLAVRHTALHTAWHTA